MLQSKSDPRVELKLTAKIQFFLMAVIYRVQSAIPKEQKAGQLAAKVAHGCYAAFCNNYAATGFIVSSTCDLK